MLFGLVGVLGVVLCLFKRLPLAVVTAAEDPRLVERAKRVSELRVVDGGVPFAGEIRRA